MVAINASEKEAITAKFPNIGIVRTMKQDSKRHHYYMEEDRGAMEMLRRLRGETVPKKKRRGHYYPNGS